MTSPEVYTYDDRKKLLDDLKLLVKSEYEEVFRIIKRANVNYSENSNGIFFDITQLSDDIIEKLTTYINMCKSQRLDELSRTQTLDSFRVSSEQPKE